MNPVLILTHNTLRLTKNAIESVISQDIPTKIYIIDNASTDGTLAWLADAENFGILTWQSFTPQLGVSAGWNYGLNLIFDDFSYDHCLVLNSDTMIPTWFYSSLLSYQVPFVTGVSVGTLEQIAEPEPPKQLAPCPDFSAFLIRREAWGKIGQFDESMVHYCGDLDYHIRAHRKGMPLWNSGVAFYHERSSTIRYASPKDKKAIELQADADREAFAEKWGCNALGKGYDAMFSKETFGCEATGSSLFLVSRRTKTENP